MERKIVKITLGCVAFICVALSGRADYYWNGGVDQMRYWFDVGNAANTAYGTWWKSGNSWSSTPPLSESLVIKVNDGGTCVLTNDLTGLTNSRLFISAGQDNTPYGEMVIDSPAVLNGVGICVSGPGSYAAGDGRLVVNGGDLTLGGGPSGFVYGLQIGYSKKPGAVGRAEVNGGEITIAKGSFVIGTQLGSAGEFLMTGGKLTSEVGFSMSDDMTQDNMAICFTNPADYASYRQTGGTVTISSGTAIIRTKARMEVMGGTFTASHLNVRKGGFCRWGVVSDKVPGMQFSLGSQYDHDVPGLVNVFEIVKGGSVTPVAANGFSLSGSSYSYKSMPALLSIKGGAYTNLTSMTVGCPLATIEVSDGGIFYVSHNGGAYGNLSPGAKPYYLRIKGRSEASVGCFAATGNDDFKAAANVIMEHVIDADGTSPVVTRNKAGGGTTTGGDNIPGNQRLRPEGGVQVVSTNQFALFHSLQVATPVAKEDFFTSAPDASLWTTGKLADHYWGSTLNENAKIALTRESKTTRVYKSETFAARPMGYCELPKTGKDKLNGVSVGLTVAAPEGGTLEGALASVKSGLESAGYTNVETNGVTGLATFDVPLERIAEKSVDQKLLLDFTETPMPATGMMSHKTVANYAYPTVTNALFTAVSVTYDKPVEGLMLIVK